MSTAVAKNAPQLLSLWQCRQQGWYRSARCAGSSSSSQERNQSTGFDPYLVLGVTQNSTTADVKTAYRRLALRWHPDRNLQNRETAEAEFKAVGHAYHILSDPQRKEGYDRSKEQGLRQGNAPNWSQEAESADTEAVSVFREMFGDKPLHEIIREVQQLGEHERLQMLRVEKGMERRLRELREDISRLEGLNTMVLASPGVNIRFKSKVLSDLASRTLDIERLEVRAELIRSTRLHHESETAHKVSQLSMMCSRADEYDNIRKALAVGAGLGTYFVAGSSLLGAVGVLVGTSMVTRLALGSLPTVQM